MEWLAMDWLATGAAAIVCAGIGQALFGAFAVRRFAARLSVPAPAAASRAPVTVLKPLHGDEPMLESALASLLAQSYPTFQVVFGVQEPSDGALAVVARLRQRYPDVDVAVAIDTAEYGVNRKIGNLINMLPLARHDVLIISDSDVHVAPDYLDRVMAELNLPGTGLVTTVYTGLPAGKSLPAALGATAITHGFLPGAVMAREFGRQDCLGATMALRRETLEAIGGLPALVGHIADDHILGKLVRAQGLSVRLAATVTATTVPEAVMPHLYQHELRWARTILALVPREYAASTIQYPLFWAALAIGVSGGADWTIGLFLVAWATRALCGHAIDRCLGATHPEFASPVPIWLLPLRDLVSMFVAMASYAGDRVSWRGRILHTGAEAKAPAEYRPAYVQPPGFAPSVYPASSYAPPGPSAAS